MFSGHLAAAWPFLPQTGHLDFFDFACLPLERPARPPKVAQYMERVKRCRLDRVLEIGFLKKRER